MWRLKYMRKTFLFSIILALSIVTLLISSSDKDISEEMAHTPLALTRDSNLIDEDSLTISSRVNLPNGYTRVNYPEGSFQNYLQSYKLKPYGSKIINYDGSEYFWQRGHEGILEIPVPSNGLQQCADALIRVRSEYLWDNNRKDEIGFNFTSGDYCSWNMYAQGYRPKIDGNEVEFLKSDSVDHSKDNFYRYLKLIYTYSGTLSMYHELETIDSASNLMVGDMLIKGGSPGHIAILCDEAIDSEGTKIFLLFQGNTPAQSVHLVKNLEDPAISPWYRLERNATIPVSNYTFQSAEFVRFH